MADAKTMGVSGNFLLVANAEKNGAALRMKGAYLERELDDVTALGISASPRSTNWLPLERRFYTAKTR